MTTGRDEVLAEALRIRLEAQRSYEAGQLRRSSRALSRASHLASAAGEQGVDIEDECRFWLGATLHGEGRLAEALAAWAPTVNRASEKSLTGERYMAITRYLLVAVDIPLPLERIEEAFDEVEACLRELDGGAGRRRSRILLARTRLALNRGDDARALELAQEALHRRRHERPSYSFSAHFRPLVRVCLRTGELDLARRYLDEWDALETAYICSKRLLLRAARIDTRLALGDVGGALALAQGFDSELFRHEEPDFRLEAGASFVRAWLAAGEPERAAPVVARLLRGRHNRVGEVRFATRLLLLDFHLAALELEAERTRDRGQVAQPTTGPNVEMTSSTAARARRALSTARRESEALDGRLQCRRHREEVQDRAGRLEGVLHRPSPHA